jgi:DNA-3-methyladenine glycosylase I
MPTETRVTEIVRCHWATANDLQAVYHDAEWGVPSHDDRHLFEMLTLEGAQAGLSWDTILRKREGYRAAFARFDPATVASFDARTVERLLLDPSIVRHRGKIDSTIGNARRVLDVQTEFGSFDRYLWQFVGGAPRTNAFADRADVPASTPESDAMSRDLKRRGFRFVGSTTCYAFMQATGMVNDHLTSCFRHAALARSR